VPEAFFRQNVGFQILTAASMKMTVLWNIAPCSFVEVTDISEMHTASIIRVIGLHQEYTTLYPRGLYNVTDSKIKDVYIRFWSMLTTLISWVKTQIS
jgi:hypothetical protein